MDDPMVESLSTATPGEARAVWQTLSEWVENEQADGDNDNPHALLHAAESMLSKLDAVMASYAEG